jgi:hypothetical protein
MIFFNIFRLKHIKTRSAKVMLPTSLISNEFSFKMNTFSFFFHYITFLILALVIKQDIKTTYFAVQYSGPLDCECSRIYCFSS